MASKNLRKRFKVDYNNEYESDNDLPIIINKLEDIKSTSKWTELVTKSLKIISVDAYINDICQFDMSLYDNALKLCIPEWTTGKWLETIDIKLLNVDNKIKTLIGKIKNVYIAESKMQEMYVDGFMDSLLHILNFDDYPCFLYPQFKYVANIGHSNHGIIAKSDFSIVSESSKMLLVIEDKTMTNATYANNWKEEQILGELFVAVHNIVANSRNNPINYPIIVYAIRVVGTLFTFYKTIATLEYIKETAKGLPIQNEMQVQRHPPVKDDPSQLTAYDICNKNDRENILKCMCSIRRFISS